MGLSVSEPGHQHDGPGVWNEIKARARFISFQDSDSRDTCNFPTPSPFTFSISRCIHFATFDRLYFHANDVSFVFSFPVFSSRLINLRKNFLRSQKKKILKSYHILPSGQELCQELFISPLPPPFSPLLFLELGIQYLKKQRMSLIRGLGNAVRTFLCTIEYDCEIIDNLEQLHRQAGCISYEIRFIKNSACGVYSHRMFINIVQCFSFSHPFFNFIREVKVGSIYIHSIRYIQDIE